MSRRRPSLIAFSGALVFLALSLSRAQSGVAQSLLDTTQTVALPTAGVPVTQDFTVTTAGSYTVTLTDLGASLGAPLSPAPLATSPPVELAVTQGSTLIASTGGLANNMVTLPFTATPGTYTIRVTGAPGPKPGSGPIGIQFSGPAAIPGFSAALALPGSAPPPSEVVVNAALPAGLASGTYGVALSDLDLPSALGTLILAITSPSCVNSLCLTLDAENGPASGTFALDSTQSYHLTAIGQLANGVAGGLASAVVTPPGGGAPVLSRTFALGSVQQVGPSFSLGAGTQSLAITDYAFPAALAQSATVVALNGVAAAPTLAGKAGGTATATFTTTAAGSAQVYVLAVPAAGGAGSYGIALGPQGGAPLLSMVQAASTASASSAAFVTAGTIATAGSYQLRLADLNTPTALASVGAALVQGNAVIGTPLTAVGSAPSAALQTGAVYAITVAKSAVSAGGTAEGGLVGVDIVPAAGGTPVLAATQGVGGAFLSTPVSVPSAGSYTVTLTDVGFPVNFSTLDAVVAEGTQVFGSILGGGKFKFQAASAGTYAINFIAQPDSTAQAGTYSIDVAPTPPLPTVTLTASPMQVSSGGTVTLTWSSTGATACTASGGWSGALTPASGGSQTSAAITSTTSFTATCTGPGGSASQSVSVTPTAPGHGGGALDASFLALLATLLGLAGWRRRRTALARKPSH